MSYYGFGFNGFSQFTAAADKDSDLPVKVFNGCLDHLFANRRLPKCLSVSWNTLCWVTGEQRSLEISGFGVVTGHSLDKLTAFDVAFVSCSASHLVTIDRSGSGHLLKWTSDDLEEVFTFSAQESTKLKECFIGDNDVAFLSEAGRVLWVSLRSAKLEAEVLTIARKVKKVSCGKEHVLILTELGTVYTFGQGSRGQLGHGILDSESDPKPVECLDGIVISDLAAGGWHSAAISSDGDLYTWGWNESGQLGFMTKSSKPSEEAVSIQAIPKAVDFSREISSKFVSCGSRHSAVLAGDGSLWTFGSNTYGQLGVESPLSTGTPTEVTIAGTKTFSEVWCGGWSTVVHFDEG